MRCSPYPFRRGQKTPYGNTFDSNTPESGPKTLSAYRVAWLKLEKNCNGVGIVSRIVMARFKNGEIVMAQIQLTLL